jgi:hypothetical protein
MRPATFLIVAIVILLILLTISAIMRTDGFITGSSPYILLSGMGMSDSTGMGDLGKSERRSYCQKCCDSGPMTCDPAYQCGDC